MPTDLSNLRDRETTNAVRSSVYFFAVMVAIVVIVAALVSVL